MPTNMQPASIAIALLLVFSSLIVAAERPRLAVLTDIGVDPDDQQSVIRLMAYANEFEIEALTAPSLLGKHAKPGPATRPELIREIVDAYGQVLAQFQQQADDWPNADILHACIVSGNPHNARKSIGEGHDTAGS